MFGQIALLTGRKFRGDIHALSPTTVLVLDEARFMRLLRSKRALRKQILKMAEARNLAEASLHDLRKVLGDDL